jgi:multiple sugar transport system substrate-binding protein/putative aldouronate transport system substrate-binding protein
MVLALSTTLVAGCGSSKGKPITLNVYSQTANYSGMQTGWFAKIMLDKFNVKLNIIKNADGVFQARSEKGDIGDIAIFGNDSTDYITAANNNLLYDWNEDNLLTDYGPYIKKHMQKALEKNKGLTKSGKVYGIGYNVASSAKDHETYFYHPDIRWDIYAKAGYPDVKTLDDFVTVLSQMKKTCPKSETGDETYGVSIFKDWDGDMVMYVKATAALYGYDEWGIGLYDCNTQTWQGCLDDNGMYLKMLKFYHELYKADLITPDSMTQNYDAAVEDYTNGVAFWTIFNYMVSQSFNTSKNLKAGKAMYALAADDQKTISYGLNVYGGNRLFTIGSKSQYPELCMKIINWLCTPEGTMVANYGPQKSCWDYDKNGKTTLTDLGLKCRNDKSTNMSKCGEGYSGTWEDGTNQMALNTWSIDADNPDSNGETYNYLNWASYQATQKFDILNDWRKHTGFTTPDEYLDSKTHTVAVATPYAMTKRSDELDVKWQLVTKAIKDYSWKAMFATTDAEFDKLVKQMQDKANGYGYADCSKFCQQEAANRKAAEDKVLAK